MRTQTPDLKSQSLASASLFVGNAGKYGKGVFTFSVWTDPFVTVAYLRQGAHQYNGMSARDWKIFMLALAIGNGMWSITLFTGMSAAEYAWMALSKVFP